MTDTTTAGPVAGWYDDPAGAAPYRWWDGAGWTQQTLDHVPDSAAPAGPADDAATTPLRDPAPASPVVPLADGSFPSRRSLRHATGEIPAAVAADAGRAHGPAQTPTQAQAPAQEPAAHDTAPAAYTPVNPLVPLHAPQADAHSPAAPSAEVSGEQAFHAPVAWAANAPAAPAPPVAPYGVAAGPYGAGAAAGVPGLLRANPFVNHRANRGLYLGIVGMALMVVRLFVWHTTLYYVAPITSVMGIVMSSMGLARAAAFVRDGYLPKGRAKAVTGLVLSIITLITQSALSGLVLLETHTPATGTSQSQVAPVQPVPTPIAGSPEDSDGQTTYVYSESLAENQIKGAIVAKTNLVPQSVTCPATEPLVIGTTFDCTITLATGPLTAHMTVMSDQGELVISSIG